MRRFLLLIIGLVLVATACRTDESIPDPVAVPETAATAQYPLTVASAAGEVTLNSQPERVVSLSATHTEMLFAIGAGDRVIATDPFSDFPAEAQELPKLDAFNLSTEEVAALDPDLVILAFDFNGEVEALDALGITSLYLPPAATLDDAYLQLETVGVAVGLPDEAQALSDSMQQEIASALSGVPDRTEPLTLFHEVDDTYYSADSSTFLGDIYRRAGFENIADAIGGGFPQLSAEYIIQADPDVIFLGDAGFGVTADSLASRPGWATMSAVESGAIVELDPNISGRWGPRTTELVAQIVEAAQLRASGGAG